MNYIKEINQFYVRIETNPLTAGAGILWHALMHVNNRANWVNEFTVASSVLCAKSGLSYSAFKRARQELKEKDYILVTSRGNQAPLYKMISTSNMNQVSTQVSDEICTEGQSLSENSQDVNQGLDQQTDQQPNQHPAPLYKQNEIKQNKTISSSKNVTHFVFQFYCENFGALTDYIQQGLNEAVKQYTSDLVLEALKRAADNGKPSWNYALGILKKWQTSNVKTVADILVAEENFRKQRATKYVNKPSVQFRPDHRRKEVIPDWFREDRLKKGIIV